MPEETLVYCDEWGHYHYDALVMYFRRVLFEPQGPVLTTTPAQALQCVRKDSVNE